MNWPDWWDWQLEISSHCLKRMQDRGFNEADLRTMLEDASSCIEQSHGTYLIETDLAGLPWEVIVAPDERQQVIVVVTADPSE
jgi:hypothetical protein